MSERKVLTKYFPPDFDPRQVGRSKAPKQSGPRVQTVRLMSPFSMRCTACGEYVYKGRKFNARKETPPDLKYLGIQIFRFYIKCTRCSGEIVFRTDPRNQDYICESGAKRNTDPWKRGLGDAVQEREETDDERLDRLEREMAEEEERNAMAELEAKTMDAKREMAVADALDEIRSRNARIERANREGGGGVIDVGDASVDEERLRQEREDEDAARKAFAFARIQASLEEVVEEEENGVLDTENSNGHSVSSSATAPPVKSPYTTTPSTEMPPPSFKRQVKKKKDHAALLGIKKKQPLV